MIKKFKKTVKASLPVLKRVNRTIIVYRSIQWCIITYQSNDLLGFTTCIIGTAVDLKTYIFKNTPIPKKVTRVGNCISISSKILIPYLYVTGNSIFMYPFHK